MRIAILGFADQGKSAFEYWNKPGNEITICDQDQNIELPSGISGQLGAGYLKGLKRFDLLVRTPSLHPRDILEANLDEPNILNKVTTNTNEFFKVSPSKNIIGVTGTKGKGTTSTLIAKMMEATGKKVHLGGNIGTPPLELLKAGISSDDWVVLELANYQLIDLNYSPHIGVCLMVVSEHLDWHKDVEEYISSKQRMFSFQTPQDIAIYNADNPNSHHVIGLSKAKKITYLEAPGAIVNGDFIEIGSTQIINVSEIKLLGKHNLENVCAAVTAFWQITQDINGIKKVLVEFTGLEHRLEFVREVGRVKFYDDSFGTTPETAIVAMEAFKEPKVLILGGSDKGAEYDKLAKAVTTNNVREVILVGATAPKIKQALNKIGYLNTTGGGQTMTDIVNAARSKAQAGDIVLLSTACASFDLFKNYKDRGDQFKSAVKALS